MNPSQAVANSVGRTLLSQVFNNSQLVNLYTISNTNASEGAIASSKLQGDTRPTFDVALQGIGSAGLYSKDRTNNLFPRLNAEQIARTIDVIEGRLETKYEFDTRVNWTNYPPAFINSNSINNIVDPILSNYRLIAQVFYTQLLEVPFITYLIDITFNNNTQLHISTYDKRLIVEDGYYGESQNIFVIGSVDTVNNRITVTNTQEQVDALTVGEDFVLQPNVQKTMVYKITAINGLTISLDTVVDLNTTTNHQLVRGNNYPATADVIKIDSKKDTAEVQVGDGIPGAGLTFIANTPGLLNAIQTEKHIGAVVNLRICFIREGKILAGPVRGGLLKIDGATHIVNPSSATNLINLSTIKTWENINQPHGVRTASAYLESVFENDGFFRNSKNAAVGKLFVEGE